jgi:hypothetical protein
MVQLQLGRELGLNERTQGCPHLGGDDLSGLRVQVSAESLEMSAQKGDVSAEGLISQERRWRYQKEPVAVGVHFSESGHAIIRPKL